jgi:SAM-dependent methyltransferase
MHQRFDKNIDWDSIAIYYDAYVRADLDRAYFLRHAAQSGDPVLELMCGTGRITLPLVEAGHRVTGVDSSRGLLDRFRAKLAARGLEAELIESDVRSLALGRRFALVYVGFHSFAEILGPEDRLAALSAIRGHVASGGRFVLTLHNPPVRAANAHSEWRVMGTFPLESGRRVEVSSRWDVDHDRARVSGIQRYRELEGEHIAKELEVPITFDLVSPSEVHDHARRVGLRVVDVRGTYDGAPFDASSSPFALFEMTDA